MHRLRISLSLSLSRFVYAMHSPIPRFSPPRFSGIRNRGRFAREGREGTGGVSFKAVQLRDGDEKGRKGGRKKENAYR